MTTARGLVALGLFLACSEIMASAASISSWPVRKSKISPSGSSSWSWKVAHTAAST